MWEAGQIISDRYQLKEKFGNNTGRQTWLAQDIESDISELVIVKLLTFGGNIQWDDVRLFEREAQILQQLNHDQIPKYKNYFSIDERTLWFGLVEEYISGNSLKQLLETGTRFGETDVIKIAQEVLQTLIYLHSFNPPILHRDIKPSNLLLGDDNKIYLVDFGAVQDSLTTEDNTFTVVGTYGYAPLEQFGGKTVPASDLYALGMTLIHLLTRTAPSNLPHKDLKIQFRDHIVPDQVTISPQLANWLDKMTAPAVERRYKNAISALKYLPEISLDLATISQNNYHAQFDEDVSHFIADKPVGSKVALKQSDDFIEITIPGRKFIALRNIFDDFLGKGNKFIPLFVLGGTVIIFSRIIVFVLLRMIFSPVSILVLFFLWLTYPKFLNLFITTKIKCDRQQFSIIKNFLGFKKIARGTTSAINDISLNYISQSKNHGSLKMDALIINTKATSKLHKNDTHILGQ